MNSDDKDDKQETLRAFGREVTETILRYFGPLNTAEIVGAIEIAKHIMIEEIGAIQSLSKGDGDE